MNFDRMRLVGLNTVDLPIVGLTMSDEFILKGVDGLGPTPYDVSIHKGYLQNWSPQDRSISAVIGLNPDYSLGNVPADLRSYLYGILVGEMVIEFLLGETVVFQTTGVVETIETPIFTKEPVAQVTFLCTSPYLEAPDPVEPSLVGLSKTAPTITNTGTAPTGFYMKIQFTDAQSSWSLVRADESEGIFLDDLAIIANDILEFNTEENSRYIRFTRPGTGLVTNLLSNLSSGSTWMQLARGLNSFETSDDGFDWLELSYTPKFVGV
jgi:hypothetical protein